MLIGINNSTKQVLGTLLKSPSILDEKNFNLNMDDFVENHHKIIFGCIYNLNKTGLKSTVDAVQLLSYMKDFNIEWYNMYIQCDINNEFLDSIQKDIKENDFEYNYNRLKKNSLLRELHNGGWDVTRIYDVTGSNKELNLNFESSTIDDILESLFSFDNQLKKKWCSDLNVSSELSSSKEGLRDLIRQFQQGDTFGIKLPNPVLNSIAKGARFGKVVLYGAGSGVGKTRVSVMNACHMAMPFKLNKNSGQWEVNGKHENVLFITTELLQEEIQSMMLSCVSNISEGKLNYAFKDLSSVERNNLNKAVALLENFPIHICHLPNYDLNDLEIIIEEYVLKHNVRYIYFDYIHLTGKIMEQLKGIREDIVILQIMTSLKNIANKYEVFIWVGSQLNRNANDSNNKDSFAVFRSAFSIGDKVDIGLATMKATTEEVDELCASLEKINNFNSIGRPNLVTTVIKNRGGQNALRIWSNFNHGTLSEDVVAITDLENNLISIEIFKQDEGHIDNVSGWIRWLNE